VTSQSRLELFEVQKQISDVEGLVKEKKSFQSRFLVSEETLKKQKRFYEDQLHQRDSDIKTLETGIKQLQTRLTEASKTHKSLLLKANAGDSGAAHLSKKSDELVSKLIKEKEELYKKYQELAKKLAAQDESMQDYCQQLKKLEFDLQVSREANLMNPSIQAQLLDRQRREAKLLIRLQELEQIKVTCLANNEQQAKENEELKESVLKLEKRLKKTEELNVKLEKQLQVIQQEAASKISTLETDHSNFVTEAEKEIQKLAAEKTSAIIQIEKVLKNKQKEAEILKLDCKSKTQKLVEFKKLTEEMQDLAIKSKNELNQHQSNNNRLEQEIEHLRQKLKFCNTEYDKMKLEQKKLREEISALQNSEAVSKDVLAKQNAEVAEELAVVKSDFQKTSLKLQDSEEKSQTLQNELHGVKSLLEEKQNDVDLKITENDELHKKISVLEKHTLILEEKISTLLKTESEYAQKWSNLENLIRENSSATDEIGVVRNKHQHDLKILTEDFEQKNKQLSEKSAALSVHLLKMKEEGEEVKSKLASLQRENGDLQCTIQQLTHLVKSRSFGLLGQQQQQLWVDSSSGDVDNNSFDLKEFSAMLHELIQNMDETMKTKDENLVQLNLQISQLQANLSANEEQSKLRGECFEKSLEKVQTEKKLLEERLKCCKMEQSELKMHLAQMKGEKGHLQKMLSESNSKIVQLQCDCIRNFDIHEKTEQELESTIANFCEKVNMQQKMIKNLEEENEKFSKKVLVDDGEICRLKEENQRQKGALRVFKSKEKKRNETSSQLKQILEEHQFSAGPNTFSNCESSLNILECLTEKFEGKAEHLESLKLCKTLRNQLLKEKNRTQLAHKVLSCVARSQQKSNK